MKKGIPRLYAIITGLILCLLHIHCQTLSPGETSSQQRIPPAVTAQRNLTNNTIEISWVDESLGNGFDTEYQLEWTFVDGTGKQFYPDNTKTVPYRFRHNCVRITTTSKQYTIADVFENGFIIFRIRTRDKITNEVSKWSLPEGGYISQARQEVERVTRCEGNKNWQFISAFAEEGKRKDIIKYLDGSGRERQSQTVINSTRHVLVSETIYDTTGRPAVVALPAPAFNGDTFFTDDLRFKTGFSVSATGP